MYSIKANSLDDLLYDVYTRLLSGNRELFKVSSRKGKSTETFGALLELTNPLARLSRSRGRARVFSALGELTWYLSGSDSLEHIKYYIPRYGGYPDGAKISTGAYGPRIFSLTQRPQWQRVIHTLQSRKESRNAVIQIYSNNDAEADSDDIPCTCTLQFVLRAGRLFAHVHMRSNDVFWGLPHDIFCFTMMQEIAAKELGCKLGTYQHSVASLHLYDDSETVKSRTSAQDYLNEGRHDIIPMPEMPVGDPWPAIRMLLEAEATIRSGNLDYVVPTDFADYWKDLVILLKVYAASKSNEVKDINATMLQYTDQITSKSYELFILDRLKKRLRNKSDTLDIFKMGEA